MKRLVMKKLKLWKKLIRGTLLKEYIVNSILK
ncbi:Uncharacterised protein [Tissierella praeacuta]|nr:Uncharacterised protein [Tissierella praeacuta]